MIRITLEVGPRVSPGGHVLPPNRTVMEFEDPNAAADWFIHDSRFAEPYTRRAVWEVIPDGSTEDFLAG